MEQEIIKGRLSQRGVANVTSFIKRMPKNIMDAGNTADESVIVDLSVAENWLIRDEILQIQRRVVQNNLHAEHLSWPRGFWGNPHLLETLARFLNVHFNPRVLIQPVHVAVAPGAAACLDALIFNICDPGEGFLVPAPYWNGYDTFCSVRTAAIPVLVPLPKLEKMASFISELQKTFQEAPCTIKALLLSNPHNPLGRCFSREELEACLRFCEQKNIHLISDEVFGLMNFESFDVPSTEEFVSVLSLDVQSLGCDLSRVHTIWSPSKVFALSGLRLGCTVTQANNSLRDGLTLASMYNISILSVLLTSAVLESPDLSSMIKVNAQRFAQSYTVLTSFLRKKSLPYLPCNAAPFVLVNLAPEAETWEEEAIIIQKLRDAGVWVSPGRSHHMPEYAKGWARVTFALEPREMEKALSRMETLFAAVKTESLDL